MAHICAHIRRFDKHLAQLEVAIHAGRPIVATRNLELAAIGLRSVMSEYEQVFNIYYKATMVPEGDIMILGEDNSKIPQGVDTKLLKTLTKPTVSNATLIFSGASENGAMNILCWNLELLHGGGGLDNCYEESARASQYC